MLADMKLLVGEIRSEAYSCELAAYNVQLVLLPSEYKYILYDSSFRYHDCLLLFVQNKEVQKKDVIK